MWLDCGLEAGHEGPHHAFGQTASDGEWWLQWSAETGADRELLVLAGCPATVDHDLCVLPDLHAGRHSFELDHDRRPIAVRFPETDPLGAGLSGPRYPTVEVALRVALSRFDGTTGVHRAELEVVDRAESVHLFPHASRRVLVVGSGGLVGQVRDALPLNGWHVAEIAARTPLDQFHNRLGNRAHNLLARNGFEYVEDVRAVSDAALLSLRGMGRGTLAAIRTELGCDAVRRSDVRLSSQEAQQLGRVLTELAEVAEAAGRSEVADRAHRWTARLAGGEPLM